MGKVYVTGFTDDRSRFRISSGVYLRKGANEAIDALGPALAKKRIPREIKLEIESSENPEECFVQTPSNDEPLSVVESLEPLQESSMAKFNIFGPKQSSSSTKIVLDTKPIITDSSASNSTMHYLPA